MISPRTPTVHDLFSRIQYRAEHSSITVYLVGGALRDVLARRRKKNPDIDFCLQRGALDFGKRLARDIRAGFVVLDKERGYCRLVKKIGELVYTLDFTDFRGKTLEDDLRKRDFTINAMAARLGQVLKGDFQGVLIDPYGGAKDIKAKAIRMVDAGNFRDDPLRILRAFSLSAIFGFRIENKTLAQLRRDRQLLASVSPERIRDELFKIFDQSGSLAYIERMDTMGILRLAMPELTVTRGVAQGPYHHLDVWKHSLETLRQLEALFGELKKNRPINAYLDEVLSAERSRRALMKLGALLHDVGKPRAKRRMGNKTIFHGHERVGADITGEFCRRLKLSNDEADALRKMVLLHLRPGYMGDNPVVSPRARFRYFRDAASEGISTLLLSIADQRSTRGPLTSKNDRVQHERVCLGLIREHLRGLKKPKPIRFINGDMLMKRFKLKPSVLVGKVLAELEELQAIGKVKTLAQAWSAAKKSIGDGSNVVRKVSPGTVSL